MTTNCCKAAVLVVALILTACSENPDHTKADTAAKADSAPSGPVSGKTAFWAMYKSAYSWSADVAPLALESKSVPGIKNEEGKAGMWSATFGSPSKHEARVFSYAVAASAPDIYKGVTVGRSIPWNGPTPAALTFDTSALVADSDAVYKTARAQAEPWAKKHPDQEVSFTLGNASRFSDPVWYVLWGNKKSGYSVLVDAKTGAIVKP